LSDNLLRIDLLKKEKKEWNVVVKLPPAFNNHWVIEILMVSGVF
jgi:hypothetical protein